MKVNRSSVRAQNRKIEINKLNKQERVNSCVKQITCVPCYQMEDENPKTS